jgi:photosystem II stability/assembly factor-like uncharacterized protein
MTFRSRLALVLILAALLPGHACAHDPSAWGGTFRSRDDGASWLPVDAGLFIGGAMALAISPADANHLLYATDTRLLRSRNGGRDWTQEAPDKLIGPILAVAFDADGHGAVASNAAGVFVTDDGKTWSESNAPTGAAPARSIVASGTPGRFYLAGPRGLYVSSDHGHSFQRLGETLPEAPPTALTVARGTPDTVLTVLDGTLWMSTDAGTNWHESRAGLPERSVEALDVGGARWWAFGADRLYVSEDRGGAWRVAGNVLPDAGTSVRGLSVSADGSIVTMTTHRGVLRSPDGARTWGLVEGALPTHLEAAPLIRDPHDVATLYAGFALTPYAEIYRRAEQGNNLLTQVDPVSLVGGLAFLLLLLIGGVLLARRLVRAYGAPPRNGESPS